MYTSELVRSLDDMTSEKGVSPLEMISILAGAIRVYAERAEQQPPETDIESIEPENGFVTEMGLKPGWYITVNEAPLAGPFDTREDADRIHQPHS